MSSEHRASSAVRNLRSIFENKANLDTDSSDSRGRSPSGLGSDKENGSRQASKVRASFVPVEPAVKMATTVESLPTSGLETTNGTGEAAEVNGSTTKRGVGRESAPIAKEDLLAVEGDAAVRSNEAPAVKQEDSIKEDKAPSNPDKPVTAAQEEPVVMKPAEPTNKQAVSGGDALPPVAEDLRPTQAGASASLGERTAKEPKTNGKPGAISTKTTSKPAPSSVKSPQTPKSAHASAPSKAPTKKASRSSLTAPTAASMARAEKSGSEKTSPSAATKKREVTKPANISSHLTAPTASSRAKHDPTLSGANSASTAKPSIASRPKALSSAKPASRVSLGPGFKGTAQTSQNAPPRRSLAPADGSFLERMMKPTAASKAHERTEVVSSPPKTKHSAPPKAKTNGTATKSSSAPKSTAQHVAEPGPSAAASTLEPGEPHDAEAGNSAPTADASLEEPATQESAPAQATPEKTTIDGPTDAALEATPAGMTSEETIR